MIGNDVVDLELARTESNWKRKGFLQKLFTVQEQALILQHQQPEVMIWVLWSMKEAAYKAYNRQTGIRAYIPHKLESSISFIEEGRAEGKVMLDTYVYLTKTSIHNNIIHTIATTGSFGITEVQPSEIKKNALGLPCIIASGIEFPASMSHHGRGVKAIILNK